MLLEYELRDVLLGLLVTQGKVQLWVGRFATGDARVAATLPRAALWTDTTKSMILEQLVLNRPDIATVSVAESSDAPLLILALTKNGVKETSARSKLENSGSFWILALDDRVVALSRIEPGPDPKHVTLTVSGDLLFAKYLRSVVVTPALSQALQVSARSSLQP